MAGIEEQSFGNFSIENTMEMGLGDSSLLNDLMSPETATSNPEDIEKIVEEVEPPKGVPKKKEVKEVDPDKPAEQNLLADFLGDVEETEETEEVKPNKEESLENEESSEVSQFAALSRDLFKLGVFTKEEDEEDIEITSPEEFLDRFNAEKKKGSIELVNNFIGQFGEDYQDAFQAIYVKGVNPKDYWGVYNNIANFAELDLSKEENQISVIKQTLSDQGLDPEDITTEIERLTNYGDLENVATKYHKVLVKKEAIKLQQLEQKAEQELQHKAQIRNQYIQNVQSILQEKIKTKEFDGIPLNPKLAGELQDFLLVDKYKTGNGELLTDFDKTILDLKRPENHAMKVKVALLLKLLEKDPTLSTIQRSGVTKKSDTLFDSLARQKTVGVAKPPQNKGNSWFQ